MSVSGEGLGDGPVELALGVLIVGMVAYLAITRVDVQRASGLVTEPA